jgi:hypothetical protein
LIDRRNAALTLAGSLVGYYILCWIAPVVNVLGLPVPF